MQETTQGKDVWSRKITLLLLDKEDVIYHCIFADLSVA